VVLFFEKGRQTQQTWFYQLNPGRNLGKTNALNDADMAEFVALQARFERGSKSWVVEKASVSPDSWDLSVKNPNGAEAVELRLWGAPDTRKTLLTALGEAGFGLEPLSEMARIIDAPDSDVFDVLAYVAFALPPISRADRVATRRPIVLGVYEEPLASFLDFVLGQYVSQGIDELDQDKLPRLLELKFPSAREGANALGGAQAVRSAFIDYQRGLFAAT